MALVKCTKSFTLLASGYSSLKRLCTHTRYLRVCWPPPPPPRHPRHCRHPRHRHCHHPHHRHCHHRHHLCHHHHCPPPPPRGGGLVLLNLKSYNFSKCFLSDSHFYCTSSSQYNTHHTTGVEGGAVGAQPSIRYAYLYTYKYTNTNVSICTYMYVYVDAYRYACKVCMYSCYICPGKCTHAR